MRHKNKVWISGIDNIYEPGGEEIYDPIWKRLLRMSVMVAYALKQVRKHINSEQGPDKFDWRINIASRGTNRTKFYHGATTMA